MTGQPTDRSRPSQQSPLPSYGQAIAAVLDAAATAGPPSTERVELSQAIGRTLAEPITADRDLPPYNRAAMDGYALRAAEFAAGTPMPIAGNLPAGAAANSVNVPAGGCVTIATGAAVPESLDVVIPHEQSDRGNPVRFSVDRVESGMNIHPRGRDAGSGDVLLQPGLRIAAHHLAIAASVGCTQLSVVRQPRVLLLTSGDEVISPGQPVEPHQIRNSNGPLLSALIGEMGGELLRHEHLLDQREPTIEAVQRGLDHADVVVTIGGISAGERDYFKAAVAALGITAIVQGASIQPGKPIFVGRYEDSGAFMVGLPGNPVSALVCSCLFLWPLLRRLSGGDGTLPWQSVTLREPVQPNPRRQMFRPAARHPDQSVTVPQWSGSGDIVHTAATTGIVALPQQERPVDPGTTLRYISFP